VSTSPGGKHPSRPTMVIKFSEGKIYTTTPLIRSAVVVDTENYLAICQHISDMAWRLGRDGGTRRPPEISADGDRMLIDEDETRARTGHLRMADWPKPRLGHTPTHEQAETEATPQAAKLNVQGTSMGKTAEWYPEDDTGPQDD